MAEIVVALDVESGAAAERLLDALPDATWVKVGSVLMGREGPPFLARLGARGLRVFLDLKWHDIPNTVAGAVAGARDAGVAMATVHTLGGARMMEAAAAAAAGELAIVGVTVLTSHDAEGYGGAVGRRGVDLEGEVVRLARAAVSAGLAGIVCSPRELRVVREVVGAGWLVVPGIRGPADAAGDQVRTATPAEAAAAGATHLVVGRPIIAAADPQAALREMRRALQRP
jgi:orotidine-5'-phosphate decarboxylase